MEKFPRKYHRNEAGKVFFLRLFSVNKFIGNFIIDRLIDRPKIMDESFTDGAFLSDATILFNSFTHI